MCRELFAAMLLSIQEFHAILFISGSCLMQTSSAGHTRPREAW